MKDIVGICSKCHGVIHFKNSVRMGYEKEAKEHFIKTNQCTELDFASHLTQAIDTYNKRNKVLRWKMIANLSKFGGADIQFKNRYIPLIKNPYDGIELHNLREIEIKDYFYISKQTDLIGPPKILSVDVDNYQGKIIVDSLITDRIEWYLDDEKIKTNYNTAGRLKIKFSVENLRGKNLYFKLVNINGIVISQDFNLIKPTNI